MTNSPTWFTNKIPTAHDRFARRNFRGIRRFGLLPYLSVSGLIGTWSCILSTAAFGGVYYPDGVTTMHFAFEGSPNGDRPIVRPPAIFHVDDGFGFVDSPGVIGTDRGVTAPNYFRFDINLPDGTYDVTVVLGGAKEESITRIKAENHQTLVQDVRVGFGQSTTKTFKVTVKHGAADDASLEGGGRLNLEFEGTNPSLMKLDLKLSSKPAGP